MNTATLSKSDHEAFVRCAAMHAENYLDRISGTIGLLVSEIGERRSADTEQLSHWATTLVWLNSLIEQEAEQLRGALDGEVGGTLTEPAEREA